MLEVEDSILLEGSGSARHAQIRKAIVDKEVQIHPGMEIGFHLKRTRNVHRHGSGIASCPQVGLKLLRNLGIAHLGS